MFALPAPLYSTNMGRAYLGDAFCLLDGIPDNSVDLVITSPPFALQRKKEYGNLDQVEYVDWLLGITHKIKRVIKPTGSFVIDLGGAYMKGQPVRSLYNFRVLIRMCDEQGWNLAEEFFWYNPAKLPSPIEWVNKRKIRAKDAVNTVWWLSKTEAPKADISRVLTPYSDRMKKLLSNQDKYYSPKLRPSGHDIGRGFGNDNGGAIPSNLLQIPNTESNSAYLRLCQLVEEKGHPARFPTKLPEFFVNFLTDPADIVLDIFAGSNTTGFVAEQNNRRWISIEIDRKYLALSALRFMAQAQPEVIKQYYSSLLAQDGHDIVLPQLARLFA